MDELEKVAELLKRRRRIDHEISRIIGRPALVGHLGEYIASKTRNSRQADTEIY